MSLSKDVMNCAEVMRTLRIGRSTVKRLLDDGELAGFRNGSVIRIASSSVRRLLGQDQDQAA